MGRPDGPVTSLGWPTLPRRLTRLKARRGRGVAVAREGRSEAGEPPERLDGQPWPWHRALEKRGAVSCDSVQTSAATADLDAIWAAPLRMLPCCSPFAVRGYRG